MPPRPLSDARRTQTLPNRIVLRYVPCEGHKARHVVAEHTRFDGTVVLLGEWETWQVATYHPQPPGMYGRGTGYSNSTHMARRSWIAGIDVPAGAVLGYEDTWPDTERLFNEFRALVKTLPNPSVRRVARPVAKAG